jgi:hypothetical protein
MCPQRPAPVQFLAPELLASCRLVRHKLFWDCGTGVVGDSCILAVDLSLGGSEVVCRLVGSGGCGGGGGGLRCRITVWVRVGVPFWVGVILIVGGVIEIGAGGIVVIIAVGSRVAVITGCRSLWSGIVVAVGIV